MKTSFLLTIPIRDTYSTWTLKYVET